MLLTKRQLIDMSMEELGIASYVFDSSPGQYQFALMRLEMLVAGWNANGIRLSYPLASSADISTLNDMFQVPNYALEALTLNLALRLAPSYRVVPSILTKLSADRAYARMANQVAQPTPTKEFPRELPLGQGNKTQTFIYQPQAPLLAGYDSELDLGTTDANGTTT